MTDRELPKIGTAVWIVRDGKVLVGKRRGESGQGMWCPPGGHLEMFETMEHNVVREAKEESGVEIENVRPITYVQDFSVKKGKHYVTHHFVADWKAREAADVEPEMIGDWGWYAWENLPEPLFYPARTFVESGYNPLNF